MSADFRCSRLVVKRSGCRQWPLWRGAVYMPTLSFSTIQRGHDRQKESLYEKLGFGKDSEAHRVRRTIEELQQGYVREAMKLKDPANNPKDMARLAELKEAYVLLRDDVFRGNYASHYYSSPDAQLHVLVDGGQVSANFNPEHQAFHFIDHAADGVAATSAALDGNEASRGKVQGSFSDFQQAFRAATGLGTSTSTSARAYNAMEASGPLNGADIHFMLKISFSESIGGCTRTLVIHKDAACTRCDGHGVQRLKKPRKCPQCMGRGSLHLPSATYHIERPCNYCGGEGNKPPPRCSTCGGRGVIPNQRFDVLVRLEPGTKSMSVCRLRHKGHDGIRGGNAGSLLVTVLVTEPPYFHCEGSTLHAMLPIPLSVALLGGVVEVPTVDGSTASLRVPPCVRTGQKLPLETYGVMNPSSPSEGDETSTSPQSERCTHVYHALLVIPRAEELTGRQKHAIQQYEEAAGLAKSEAETEAEGDNDFLSQSAQLKKQLKHWFTA